jgi:hypothetical protein
MSNDWAMIGTWNIYIFFFLFCQPLCYGMYGVCLLNSQKTKIKIKHLPTGTGIDISIFIFSFFSVGPSGVKYFLQCTYYCWSASAKLAAPQQSLPPHYFFLPHPASARRPPDWGWGRPARILPSANHQQRTVSKMVKKLQWSYGMFSS